MRVNGLKGSEIAQQLGLSRNAIYNELWSACKKIGIKNDPALLTRTLKFAISQ